MSAREEPQDRELELTRFAEAVAAAPTLEELDRVFLHGFGRLMDVEMYGFNLVAAGTGSLEHNAAANVSDIFVAKYARHVMDEDPLRAYSIASGRAAYNLALMTLEEWTDSQAYREAYRIHGMRHVIEAPMLAETEYLGALHFGSGEPARNFTEQDIALAEAFGRLLGSTVAGLRHRERAEVERNTVLEALDLTGTAFVISDVANLAVRPNRSAEHLLSRIVDSEDRLHSVLARPPNSLELGPFSRRLEVELVTGGTAVLHANSSPLTGPNHGLVTVLELQTEQPRIAAGALASLTAREAEVALLIVEGLADREIAERLHLSHHTVSQYAKRVYGKLDVDSRVALTRLLLGPPSRARRS